MAWLEVASHSGSRIRMQLSTFYPSLFLQVFEKEQNAVIAGLPSLEDQAHGFVCTETAGTMPGLSSFEGDRQRRSL